MIAEDIISHEAVMEEAAPRNEAIKATLNPLVSY